MPVLLTAALLWVSRLPPLPAVISWQAFRISIGPPAWLQPAFLLILFFWSTTHRQTQRYGGVILVTAADRHTGCYSGDSVINLSHAKFIIIPLKPLAILIISLYAPSPTPSVHLCCRVVQGEKWSTQLEGGGTGRPGSVSRRSQVEGDTGQLCSTQGPHASEDLQWCSGTRLVGIAAPGWEECEHTWLVKYSLLKETQPTRSFPDW